MGPDVISYQFLLPDDGTASGLVSPISTKHSTACRRSARGAATGKTRWPRWRGLGMGMGMGNVRAMEKPWNSEATLHGAMP